jgi:hypothetical protein
MMDSNKFGTILEYAENAHKFDQKYVTQDMKLTFNNGKFIIQTT